MIYQIFNRIIISVIPPERINIINISGRSCGVCEHNLCVCPFQVPVFEYGRDGWEEEEGKIRDATKEEEEEGDGRFGGWGTGTVDSEESAIWSIQSETRRRRIWRRRRHSRLEWGSRDEGRVRLRSNVHILTVQTFQMGAPDHRR